MTELKFCFIGLGSIAKRHIRNLYTIAAEDNYKITIDVVRHGKNKAFEDIGISNIYYSIDEMPDDYDAVFITNPTELHFDTLQMIMNKSGNFFIEKPVCTPQQIEEFNRLKLSDRQSFYVAGPLRYNAVIQYIKNNINVDEVISIRSISSSYLPDWRPGTDYRDTYSAHKELGGGVSIDLIHEWDYVTYLFGGPSRINALIGQKSNLEIDSDDYAIYIAEYDDKIAEIHLDYFGRKTLRKIELFTKYETIVGDIANNCIDFLKSGEHISFNEERDDFQKRELRYFLSIVNNPEMIVNDIPHALNVLKLTQGKVD